MGLTRETVDTSRNIDTGLLDRDELSFAYAARVRLPFGSLGPAIDWCKNNLGHDWRWQMVSFPNQHADNLGDYIFYFDGNQDHMLFCLKYLH